MMKIGPVDIGVNVLVKAGVAAGMGGLLLALWSNGKPGRIEGMARDRIITALNSRAPDHLTEGVKAARELLDVKPDHLPARFALAEIYHLQGDSAGAQAQYQEIAALPGATPGEKATALAAAGTLAYTRDANEGRKLLLAAAEAGSADAHIRLAVAEFTAGKTDEAEKHVNQALSAALPAGPAATATLHHVHGKILSQKNQFADAHQALERARAVQPGLNTLDESRRGLLVGGVLAAGLESNKRKEMIQKLYSEAQRWEPPRRVRALNALGQAWILLSTNTADAQAWFPEAKRYFNEAISTLPSDSAAYLNYAAILQDRAENVLKSIAAPIPGLTAPPPPQLPAMLQLKGDDQNRLSELRSLLNELERHWERFADRQGATKEEKADARQRQLHALRRLACVSDDPVRTADRLKLAAGRLVEVDQTNGSFHYQQGVVLLEMGDKAGALKAFETAKTRGATESELARLITELVQSRGVAETRPLPAVRWFGVRPLLVATLKSETAAKDALFKLGVREIKATLRGSQAIALPSDADLAEPAKTASLVVIDAGGNKEEFAASTVAVEKREPPCAITPDSATVPGNVIWTVAWTKPDDVDLNSVRVLLIAPGLTPPMKAELVVSGKYTQALPLLNAQKGAKIAQPKFNIASPSDLKPGEYILRIEAKDMDGERMTRSRIYNVR